VDVITKAGREITQVHLRMGRPAEEIMRLSEELVVGLIVLGNQGLGGRFSRMRRFLMGSVSEKVSRYARCSVMVVRRDLYERPPRLIRHRSPALLEGVREANRSSRRLGEGFRVEDAGQDFDCSTSLGAGGVDFPRPQPGCLPQLASAGRGPYSYGLRPFSWPYSLYCRVEVL
jgi:Universal stress protein family